jgi:hypothetical protein
MRFWEMLWRAIPSPVSDGQLLLAVDDSINAKTGRKVFACQRSFEPHARLLARHPCETLKLAYRYRRSGWLPFRLHITCQHAF